MFETWVRRPFALSEALGIKGPGVRRPLALSEALSIKGPGFGGPRLGVVLCASKVLSLGALPKLTPCSETGFGGPCSE